MNAAPAATTTMKATDVEDLLSLGIPFQQNGVVYKKGDKPKKRKMLSEGEEASIIHDNLDSNVTGGNNLESSQDGGTQIEMDQAKLLETRATASLGSACDTAVITPSNSMEEVETNITSSDSN